MVPIIESSIDSAFRNEAFEVTVQFLEVKEKKCFEKRKGNVELGDVFGAVVPGVEVV